ncbi:hypothetical protein HDU92_001938 [Lobulomyces angularis]|nr:hypothetical protein HDU92_001938 [Lobulomyces angularis]
MELTQEIKENTKLDDIKMEKDNVGSKKSGKKKRSKKSDINKSKNEISNEDNYRNDSEETIFSPNLDSEKSLNNLDNKSLIDADTKVGEINDSSNELVSIESVNQALPDQNIDSSFNDLKKSTKRKKLKDKKAGLLKETKPSQESQLQGIFMEDSDTNQNQIEKVSLEGVADLNFAPKNAENSDETVTREELKLENQLTDHLQIEKKQSNSTYSSENLTNVDENKSPFLDSKESKIKIEDKALSLLTISKQHTIEKIIPLPENPDEVTRRLSAIPVSKQSSLLIQNVEEKFDSEKGETKIFNPNSIKNATAISEFEIKNIETGFLLAREFSTVEKDELIEKISTIPVVKQSSFIEKDVSVADDHLEAVRKSHSTVSMSIQAAEDILPQLPDIGGLQSVNAINLNAEENSVNDRENIDVNESEVLIKFKENFLNSKAEISKSLNSLKTKSSIVNGKGSKTSEGGNFETRSEEDLKIEGQNVWGTDSNSIKKSSSNPAVNSNSSESSTPIIPSKLGKRQTKSKKSISSLKSQVLTPVRESLSDKAELNENEIINFDSNASKSHSVVDISMQERKVNVLNESADVFINEEEVRFNNIQSKLNSNLDLKQNSQLTFENSSLKYTEKKDDEFIEKVPQIKENEQRLPEKVITRQNTVFDSINANETESLMLAQEKLDKELTELINHNLEYQNDNLTTPSSYGKEPHVLWFKLFLNDQSRIVVLEEYTDFPKLVNAIMNSFFGSVCDRKSVSEKINETDEPKVLNKLGQEYLGNGRELLLNFIDADGNKYPLNSPAALDIAVALSNELSRPFVPIYCSVIEEDGTEVKDIIIGYETPKMKISQNLKDILEKSKTEMERNASVQDVKLSKPATRNNRLSKPATASNRPLTEINCSTSNTSDTRNLEETVNKTWSSQYSVKRGENFKNSVGLSSAKSFMENNFPESRSTLTLAGLHNGSTNSKFIAEKMLKLTTQQSLRAIEGPAKVVELSENSDSQDAVENVKSILAKHHEEIEEIDISNDLVLNDAKNSKTPEGNFSLKSVQKGASIQRISTIHKIESENIILDDATPEISNFSTKNFEINEEEEKLGSKAVSDTDNNDSFSNVYLSELQDNSISPSQLLTDSSFSTTVKTGGFDEDLYEVHQVREQSQYYTPASEQTEEEEKYYEEENYHEYLQTPNFASCSGINPSKIQPNPYLELARRNLKRSEEKAVGIKRADSKDIGNGWNTSIRIIRKKMYSPSIFNPKSDPAFQDNEYDAKKPQVQKYSVDFITKNQLELQRQQELKKLRQQLEKEEEERNSFEKKKLELQQNIKKQRYMLQQQKKFYSKPITNLKRDDERGVDLKNDVKIKLENNKRLVENYFYNHEEKYSKNDPFTQISVANPSSNDLETLVTPFEKKEKIYIGTQTSSPYLHSKGETKENSEDYSRTLSDEESKLRSQRGSTDSPNCGPNSQGLRRVPNEYWAKSEYPRQKTTFRRNSDRHEYEVEKAYENHQREKEYKKFHNPKVTTNKEYNKQEHYEKKNREFKSKRPMNNNEELFDTEAESYNEYYQNNTETFRYSQPSRENNKNQKYTTAKKIEEYQNSEEDENENTVEENYLKKKRNQSEEYRQSSNTQYNTSNLENNPLLSKITKLKLKSLYNDALMAVEKVNREKENLLKLKAKIQSERQGGRYQSVNSNKKALVPKKLKPIVLNVEDAEQFEGYLNFVEDQGSLSQQPINYPINVHPTLLQNSFNQHYIAQPALQQQVPQATAFVQRFNPENPMNSVTYAVLPTNVICNPTNGNISIPQNMWSFKNDNFNVTKSINSRNQVELDKKPNSKYSNSHPSGSKAGGYLAKRLESQKQKVKTSIQTNCSKVSGNEKQLAGVQDYFDQNQFMRFFQQKNSTAIHPPPFTQFPQMVNYPILNPINFNTQNFAGPSMPMQQSPSNYFQQVQQPLHSFEFINAGSVGFEIKNIKEL